MVDVVLAAIWAFDSDLKSCTWELVFEAYILIFPPLLGP